MCVSEGGGTERVLRPRGVGGAGRGQACIAGSPVPAPAGAPLLCYALWQFQKTEGNLIQQDLPLFCWSCISRELSSVIHISSQYL